MLVSEAESSQLGGVGEGSDAGRKEECPEKTNSVSLAGEHWEAVLEDEAWIVTLEAINGPHNGHIMRGTGLE